VLARQVLSTLPSVGDLQAFVNPVMKSRTKGAASLKDSTGRREQNIARQSR